MNTDVWKSHSWPWEHDQCCILYLQGCSKQGHGSTILTGKTQYYKSKQRKNKSKTTTIKCNTSNHYILHQIAAVNNILNIHTHTHTHTHTHMCTCECARMRTHTNTHTHIHTQTHTHRHTHKHTHTHTHMRFERRKVRKPESGVPGAAEGSQWCPGATLPVADRGQCPLKLKTFFF